MILAIHERAFLSNLKGELAANGLGAEEISTLSSSMKAGRNALMARLAEWRSSLKGDWFALCCLLVASHQALAAHERLDPARSHQLVDRAFFASSQWAAKSMLHLVFRGGDTPEVIASKVRRWIVPLMRGAIETEREVAPDFAALNVCRCRFNEFFAAAGEPSLTRVLCRYDQIWLAEVSKITGHPYARPETLSTGGTRCRFQFAKDDAASPGDVVGEP